VGHTFFFLTASLVAGQNAGTEIITIPQSSPHASLGDPVPPPNLLERMRSWKPFARNEEPATSDHPRLFQRVQSRLSGLFQRHPDSDGRSGPALTPGAGGSIPTKINEPPLAEPHAKAPNLSVAPINFRAAKATAARKQLSPRVAEKAGHDASFTWITGQLRKESGTWVIHYSNPEVVDRFGGRLTLKASAAQMSTFRDGDLVSVQGRVTDGRYTATSVVLVEHETN
jgi:hypothetical protein